MTDTTDAIVEAMALAMVNRAQERIDLPRIDSIADFRCEADCAEFLADARTALAAALPMLREVAGDILDPYVDSYKTMSRMGDGRVNCLSVHWDIKKNMAGYIRARFDAMAKEIEAG